MKVLSVQDVSELIERHGFNNFLLDLVRYLEEDLMNWHQFDKMPRPASHVDGGVIELMPICNKEYYGFKYVNGHPKNPFNGKQTVIATGQLSRVEDGYPVLSSEMTVLTGFRTAATSMIATKYMARKDARTLALIGTGAQSEFQTLGMQLVSTINTVRYFDVDSAAMDKYERNMQGINLQFQRCDSAESAVNGADIIVVCTACKKYADVIVNEWIQPGVHINGLGGDCPGKTELDAALMRRADSIFVEYLPQTIEEGDIQRLTEEEVSEKVTGELWQLVTGERLGRQSNSDVTIFDGVGFAIEDYSVLRLAYDLATHYNLGTEMDLIPPIEDPKNLISVLPGYGASVTEVFSEEAVTSSVN